MLSTVLESVLGVEVVNVTCTSPRDFTTDDIGQKTAQVAKQSRAGRDGALDIKKINKIYK